MKASGRDGSCVAGLDIRRLVARPGGSAGQADSCGTFGAEQLDEDANYRLADEWRSRAGGPCVKVGGPEDRVVDRDLPRGIRARVFRDGMIAFALGDSDPTYRGDFLAWQQTLVRLMNAHLACLHASCPPPGVMLSSVVTIWSTLQVELETGAFRAASTGNSGGFATDLYDLRRAAPINPFDQRSSVAP